MGQRTSLYQLHRAGGGKIVDFGGWDMPLHYGSQIREHETVRRDCGMFDVSHMRVVDVAGAEAEQFLRYLLANDVARISPGKALYTTMLNERGGIIDDLIVYFLGENDYRLVVNCATGEGDIEWMRARSDGFAVTITPRPDLGIIAVQGPNALERVKGVVCEDARRALEGLAVFGCRQVGSWTLARTGYTGEDGAEIILPGDSAPDLWQRLADAGVAPVGLGARDTLRLEAGLNLYGNDMDDTVSPLQSNLAWTVAWEPEDRQFIGRDALEAERRAGPARQLVGLVMTARGVLRSHQVVKLPGHTETGEITSGTFSPTLGCAIAMARVPSGSGGEAVVEIRGKEVPVRIVDPCFVRKGRKLVDVEQAQPDS